MKKALSLILVLVLCLSLCACGSGSQDTQPQKPNNDNTSNDNTSQAEGEPLIILDPDNGYSIINHSRFDELIEAVELTTENWMEYLEVCSFTENSVQKDAFGEVVSIETNTFYVLGAKGNQYYMFNDDFTIELKNKTTGTLTVYQGNLFVSEDFCLDEYECTRIKGTLSFVDIPAEVITVDPDTGERIYRVGIAPDWYTLYAIAGVDGRRCGLLY